MQVKCEIRPYNGVLTLFVDDEPYNGLMFMPAVGHAQHPNAESFPLVGVREFGQAGVRIFNAGPTPVYRTDGSGEMDFARIDGMAHAILNDWPDALMIPRVMLGPPPGWLESHPEERLLYHNGQSALDGSWPRKAEGSWTSEKWREAAAEELTRYVRHVELADYGERVIGYHINHGISGEWVHPGTYTGHLADYSPANTLAFRQWLIVRYGDEAALREAWGDPSVSFSSARIPSFEQRKGDFLSVMRSPRTDMRVVDHYLFHAHSVADTLCYFAHVTKEACSNRKLVAAFYGYLMAMSWHPDAMLESGHLGLREILDCADIDIITSPCTYSNRAVGSGVSSFPGVLGSVALAGKLWLDENDVRTHLGHQPGWGWTENLDQTVQVQRRQIAAVTSNGVGSWWMDQEACWYDDPAVMNEIANLVGISNRLMGYDRTSEAEIALVVDDASMAYTESNNNISWSFLEGMNVAMARVGAPSETILLSDLPRCRDYRLYIFVNAYALDDATRRMIDGVVKRSGKTCAWMYAAGYVRERSASVENMRALTGIDIREARGHAVLTAETVPGALGLSEPIVYGSDRWLSPIFYVDDEAAETLALAQDFGRPVLARKGMGDWTSVYSMSGPLSPAVIRELARDAGAHIWCDSDCAFYACKSFFGIHAKRSGLHTVRLPRRAHVYDLLTNDLIAADTSSVDIRLEAGQTGLYLMTAGEVLQC